MGDTQGDLVSSADCSGTFNPRHYASYAERVLWKCLSSFLQIWEVLLNDLSRMNTRQVFTIYYQYGAISKFHSR